LKILFISYDGMTDPLGQSQVIPYLQGLSENGHDVWLISFEKPERFKLGFEEIRNLLEKAEITWLPQTYTSKPPVLSTLKDIRTMRKVAFETIKKEQIEVVHCRSYISALIGQAAKKKFGTRFIFDMRGFWADERVDGGLWKLSNPIFKRIYSFFKKKERQFLLEADAVVSLTQNAASEIHSWKGFQHVPITVIPCCADLDLFVRPEETHIQNLKKELNIPADAFVLTYLGSLGTWYMLTEMLEFFKTLTQSKPNAHFLFLTADEPSMVFEEAEKMGIPKSQIRVKRAARKEVPLWASVGNASMFFIRPLFSKKASSPTKMGELMSLGMPLICNNQVGDVEQILRDGGNGIILNSFDKDAYEKAISELDEVLALNPQNSIDCAYKYYSLKSGIDSYLSIYKRL
jgi:glycosyltransferase involved in cell wall biosynthesis